MNRCYCCGEWEVVTVTHGHGDDETSHSYCRNCDKGVCEDC